jgi:DNA polymerase III subunit delta
MDQGVAMQYQSLLNSIERGVLSPVYLFYGEEDYLQESALRALKDFLLNEGTAAFNLDEMAESVSSAQVVESANTWPVFAEKRLVIVKNPAFLAARKGDGEDEAPSQQDQALLKYLDDPSASTCLVIVVKGTVDKRRKLVKALEKKGVALEFAPLKGEELSFWIKNEAKRLGKGIEPKALEYVIFSTNHKLNSLKNELEKLALYSQKEETITLEAVERLLTKTSEANIFALVDSIGFQKAENALQELRNLLEKGEPPARILFMIARHIRLILSAKEMAQKGYSEKQITRELSLHPFVTGKIMRQGRNFTYEQLEKGLRLLLDGDVGLKTGTPGRVVLENIILSFATSRLN